MMGVKTVSNVVGRERRGESGWRPITPSHASSCGPRTQTLLKLRRPSGAVASYPGGPKAASINVFANPGGNPLVAEVLAFTGAANHRGLVRAE
jgi:hypothetical protein